MKKKIKTIFTLFFIVLGFALAAPGVSAEPLLTKNSTSALQGDYSYNWSGYVAYGGNYTSVSGTWIVPNVAKEHEFSADVAWVGIGGTSSNNLIQAGTQDIANTNGIVSYQAWYELLPESSKEIPMIVNPGDSVTAAITQESGSQWLISLKDNTDGNNYKTTVNYASDLSTAEWIEEAPSLSNGLIMPLDDFGTIDFSNCSASKNGQALNLSQLNAQALTMVNLFDQTLVKPSIIAAGSDFNVSREENETSQNLLSQLSFPGVTIVRWQRGRGNDFHITYRFSFPGFQ